MAQQLPTFKAIEVNGVRPLAVSKKILIQVLGSVKLAQRMLYATRHSLERDPWLRIVRWGRPGCELLVDTSSIERAYERLLSGESHRGCQANGRQQILRRRTGLDGRNHDTVAVNWCNFGTRITIGPKKGCGH